ncbi:MAG: hypothetical protein ACE5FN_12170 [Leptospirillia bacterium]
MQTEKPPFELTRHTRQLTAKQADEVVDAVADLIVSFLKTTDAPATGWDRKKETTNE